MVNIKRKVAFSFLLSMYSCVVTGSNGHPSNITECKKLPLYCLLKRQKMLISERKDLFAAATIERYTQVVLLIEQVVQSLQAEQYEPLLQFLYIPLTGEYGKKLFDTCGARLAGCSDTAKQLWRLLQRCRCEQKTVRLLERQLLADQRFDRLLNFFLYIGMPVFFIGCAVWWYCSTPVSAPPIDDDDTAACSEVSGVQEATRVAHDLHVRRVRGRRGENSHTSRPGTEPASREMVYMADNSPIARDASMTPVSVLDEHDPAYEQKSFFLSDEALLGALCGDIPATTQTISEALSDLQTAMSQVRSRRTREAWQKRLAKFGYRITAAQAVDSEQVCRIALVRPRHEAPSYLDMASGDSFMQRCARLFYRLTSRTGSADTSFMVGMFGDYAARAALRLVMQSCGSVAVAQKVVGQSIGRQEEKK